MAHLTKAESAILGYLISVQGTEQTGSTINEIINGTGLGINTVYVYMRKGIPGVRKSNTPGPNGATQYYVNQHTLKADNPAASEIPTALLDSLEYKNVNDSVVEGIKETVKDKPASIERINEIIAAMSNVDRVEFFVVGGQAIALLGLELLNDKSKVMA